MRRLRRRDRGQAIVLVAIGMAVFFGFLALVVDGGSAYLEQQDIQRAADLSALSGSWAFYHSYYQGHDGYAPPADAATAVTATKDAMNATLSANGYPAANPDFVNVAGANVDTAGPACVTPGTMCPVRGVHVHLSRVLSARFIQVVGGGPVTVTADSTAMIGPPSGGVREAPLLLANNTDATYNIPRAAGCATNPPDGQRYTLEPDCRPLVLPNPAVFNLLAAGAPAPVNMPAGPAARYFVLHDPSTNAAGAATSTSVHSGLAEYLQTCRPAPCATPLSYADLSDPPGVVSAGMNARLADASNPRFLGQTCTNPAGPPALSASNPRLMRLPVTYQGDLGGAPAGVGAFRVSETLTWCLDSITTDGSGAYALAGYIVEAQTSDPTLLSRDDPYFGRDVVIKLAG